MTRPNPATRKCAVCILFSLVTALASSVCASTPAHSSLVVLLDASGSMRKTDPNRLRVEAFELLLALSKDGDRLALCEFGDGVRDLSNSFVDINGASRVSLASSATNCGNSDATTDVLAALRRADDLVSGLTADERRAYPPIVLFLTDGKDDVPGNDPGREAEIVAAAEAIAQAGAKIYGLGLSRDADRNLFRRLEVATGGETYYAESSTDLLEGFFAISRAIAGRWLIAEQSTSGAEIAIDVPPWATGITVGWFATSGATTGELTVNGTGPTMKRLLYQLVSTTTESASLSIRVPQSAGKLIVDAQGELLLNVDLPGTVARGLPFACTAQIMGPQGARLGSPLFLQRATGHLAIAHSGNTAASEIELYDDGGHGDRAARDGLFGANPLNSGDGAASYILIVRAPFSPTLTAAGTVTVLAEPVRVRMQKFVPRLVGAAFGRGGVVAVENLTDVPFDLDLVEQGQAEPVGSPPLLAPRGSTTYSVASRPALFSVRHIPATLHISDFPKPVWAGSIALLPKGALPALFLALIVAFGLSFYFPRRTTSGFRLIVNYLASGEADQRVEHVPVRSDGYPEFAEISAPFDRAVKILPISGIWRKGAYLVPGVGLAIDFSKRRPSKASRGYVIRNGSSWSIRADSSRATYTFYSKR